MFFKPGKTSVRLIDVELDDLIEGLSSRSGLRFDYAERKTRKSDPLSFNPLNEPPGEDDSDVWIERGDLSADCAPLDLQRRLKGLQKRDAEWDQEQGIKILYLALGFVTWVDEDEYEGRAPLLLLQSILKRSSPKDPFVLSRDSDEPETNPTLAYRFGQLGIELPDLGDGGAAEYLEGVKELVGNREGWSVDSDVYLSTFAYNKQAMWQDLERLRNDGVSHPLILDMAAQGTQRVPTNVVSDTPSPFPSDDQLTGGKLDDLLELRDQVTVVGADFSQLEAIEVSRRGQDLVVHGPPGTGKSQTITNIIAALIADGKKVLFVSEKRAALDVVKRNLERCNLGVFCLDMHSKYARKSAVYEQIRESLSADPATRPMKSGRLDELSSLREQLNEFVREIHQPRAPLGRSIFDMSGVYAAVRSAPSIDCDELSWIRGLKEVQYASINRVADRLVQRRKEFREHESSHWRSLKATSFHLGLGDEIRRDLLAVQREIRRLKESARFVAEGFSLAEASTADGVGELQHLSEHFKVALGVPRLWLEPGCVDECIRQVDLASSLSKERRQLNDETLRLFGERRVWPDFDELYARLGVLNGPSAADGMAELFGNEWKAKICGEIGKKIEIVARLASALTDLRDDMTDVSAALGSFPCLNWADLETACDVAGRIVKLCPVPTSWLAENRRVKEEVVACKTLAAEVIETEKALARDFDESFVDQLDAGMALRYRTDYQSFLRSFRPQYWRDRRFLLGHMNRPHNLSIEESLKSIDEARKVESLRKRWSKREVSGSEFVGSRYGGIGTDWCQIESEVRSTEELVSVWPTDLSTLTNLLTDPQQAHAVHTVLAKLRQNRQRVSDSLSDLGRAFPVEDTPDSLLDLTRTVCVALTT